MLGPLMMVLAMTMTAGVAAAAQSPYPVALEFGVRIPMRDGIALSTDIYRPDSPGRFPVILVRTPYDNGLASSRRAGKHWATLGYVYAVQDVRGRGDSDGEFYPLVAEAKDGHDTIEWLARQPWSSGRVGTTGGSYLGWTQVYAAIENPPSLKAMVPIVTPADPDRNFPMQFGAFGPTVVSWLAYISGKTLQDISELDLNAAYTTLPLREADRVLGWTSKAWRDWLDHPAQDEYWRAQRYQERLLQSDVPMLHVSGWYDDVLSGTLENFVALTSSRGPAGARARQRLIVGPWGHGVNQSTKMGEIDFGPTALIDLPGIQRRWFDRWLKDDRNGVDTEAPVRIFVMGRNVWRDEQEWPLARTRYLKYYLRSGGNANTLFGDGRLDTLPPDREPADRYRYDPANPTPFITEPSFSQVGGPDDYRGVERRDDVLVYTADPVRQPTEICGPLVVRLVAASSAKDTDWATKVLAVRPDGFAMRLNDGLVRARFAKDPSREQFVTPGQAEAYQIDNWATCFVLEPGWRLRLEVASAAFPKFDRNLNTGGRIGYEAVGVAADQTVFHERGRESYVVVPVITR